MAEFVRVARLSDIPPGTMKEVKARGKEILVANVDGEAYAIGNRCTHMRYRLSKGTLDGPIVECPGHGTKYDVTDGGICNWVQRPAPYKFLMDAAYPGFMKRAAASYPTRVEGDDIYVEV